MKLTCAACGHEGFDVLMRIVELETAGTMRVQGSDGEYRVPERFAAEPRCIDRTACEDRQLGVMP